MYIFIDTDPGLDDFLALSYVFKTNTLEVVAVSSTPGNVDIDSSTKNLKFICGIFGKKLNKRITIYKGISKPIIHIENTDAKRYHGNDGLGEFWASEYAKENEMEINSCFDHCIMSDVPAVQGLIEMSKKYSGELVVVALGPLGNIALAQLIDPDFGSRLKEIVIMGGTITGSGNSDNHFASEFNFSFDPEAAYVVFKEITCRKTVLPVETVLPLSISYEKSLLWLEKLEANTDLYSNILKSLLKFKQKKKISFRLYDLILAVLLVDPTLITDIFTIKATIELFGKFSRGMVVIDFYNKTTILDFQIFSEINFIKTINCDKILEILDNFFYEN